MAIARFLDCVCFALWASGPWLRYATLQNLIPSFPWIASPRPPPWRNPRKGRDQILPSGNVGYAKDDANDTTSTSRSLVVNGARRAITCARAPSGTAMPMQCAKPNQHSKMKGEEDSLREDIVAGGRPHIHIEVIIKRAQSLTRKWKCEHEDAMSRSVIASDITRHHSVTSRSATTDGGGRSLALARSF